MLAVVPNMVAGTRLMDVLLLLESDSRIQVVFTVAPTTHGEEWYGTTEFIQAQGGIVLPWRQAMQHRFDLVLASSYIAIDQPRGEILYVPHGASAVMSRLYARTESNSTAPTHGLEREYLMRMGRLIPSALMLTHKSELAFLAEACPEALAVAHIAGDICYDRLLASHPLRAVYRERLGVGDHQKLVLVSSTWRPESLYGKNPDLLDRICNELPSDKYKIVMVMHPNTWSIYGEWQIRSWLARCLRKGLMIVPPEEGWRAALVAADCVIGDHGSVTAYAAALDKPVLLASPMEDVRSGSLADHLARAAPRLDLRASAADQIQRACVSYCQGQFADVSNLISSKVGQAGVVLRTEMYRLLKIPPPDFEVEAFPVPLPQLIKGCHSIGDSQFRLTRMTW